MTLPARPTPSTCFFEHDPTLALTRRAAAEGVGTLLLMLVATGSGLTAQHLFAGQPALGLLMSAGATAGALVGLIIAFGGVSGGHFNPLITGLQWLAGERRSDCTLAYIVAQIVGAIMGATLASLIFHGAKPPETPQVAGWFLALSEVVASGGLMIVVFGCARSGRAETGPFAVGAWLVGAIIATPSASYANPAIALGAIFASGPIALPLNTAFLYVPAEVAGALAAILIVTFVYPLRQASEHAAASPATAFTEPLS